MDFLYIVLLLTGGLIGFLLTLKKTPNPIGIEKILKDQKEKQNEYEKKQEENNDFILNLKNELQKVTIERNNLKEHYISLEKKSSEEIKLLSIKIEEVTNAKQKITSQKKSSEVRLGHIAETLAPFLDQFEFDPETCVFIGKPIDYISFSDDEITFIEVKSGKSQLNQKQRHIRDQVKSKLVKWKEVRIK